MFISPTTHQARSVPRNQRSRAQYTHATIIAASSPPATTFDAWPSIAACRPAEVNASAAHARRPRTGPTRNPGTDAAADISLLIQVQTHRTGATQSQAVNIFQSSQQWQRSAHRKLHPGSWIHADHNPGCSLGGLEAEDPDTLLAHVDLAHLPGDGHRELVDDADVARDFVVRQLAGREGLHGVNVQRGPVRLHPDPRANLLAVLLVGDADHLSILDVRVGVKEFLDLAGINVLPTADHHVLDAANDVAIP